MSSRLNKIAQFQDQDKNSSFDSDYANRNELKRIENNSDKSFSSDFDKLNESLYKINNFLKISKEIDDIKKESSVKNDIQRKLSLKSQWLNSQHGSTGSLNSLPPVDPRNSGTSSTQSLNRNAADELKKKRKNFSTFKSRSAQNINIENEKPRRLRKHSKHNSFDELNFVEKLKLSDEDISRLSQEPEFQGLPSVKSQMKKFGGSSNSLKVELPKRVRSVSDSRDSLQKSSSQRDISKYFPKTESKPRPEVVNKNQKELKDVDLSRYFLPTPVQELKSIPSPSQSPKLPRKPINQKSTDDASSGNLLRTAIDNLQKLGKKPSQDDASVEYPKKQFFTMHDQQLDGDVTLKIPVFTTIPTQKAQQAAIITDDDCEAFFNSLKSPTEDLDAVFDKVAADALPGSLKKQEKKPLNYSPKKIVPKPIEKKELKPMTTDRHKFSLDKKSEADILGKLSSNLLNEIKLLEKHLELNEKQNETKIRKPSPKKAEEDLNKSIDAILNSPEKENEVKVDKPQVEKKFKQNMPAVSKPKKVNLVKLPKSIQSTKIDHKPPISANKAERKTVEVKSFETPTPVPRAKVEKLKPIEKKKDEKPINNGNKRTEKVNLIAKVDSVDSVDGTSDTVSYSFKPKPVTEKVEEVTLSLPRKKSVISSPESTSNRNSIEKSLPSSSKQSLNDKSRASSNEKVSNETNNRSLHIDKPKLSDDNAFQTDSRTSTPSINDARKAYFAELNKQPSSSSAQSICQTIEISNDKPKIDEKVSSVEPPIKPERRRSRKSSASSQNIKDEQTNAQPQYATYDDTKLQYVTYGDATISSQNLAKTAAPKYKDDIPELSNIARLLNSSENTNEKLISNGKVSFDSVQNESNENGAQIEPQPMRNRSDYQRAVRKSFGSGDYDNLPSTSRRAMFKDSKTTSRSVDIPTETDRDYDNIVVEPIRRLSIDKKKNVTDMLLERSKQIHSKKQDFINEKLTETNPYIRRMIEKEHRFRPTYDRSYISPTRTTATNHYDYHHQPYSHSVHRPLPTSALSSSISHSPIRTNTLPSSSNRSVLDLFRQPASNNKDSCIIS